MMSSKHRFPEATGHFFLSAFVALASIGASLVHAKEYDPYVMYVFPAGGQRGTTVERMARGRGLEGTSEVRISGPGVTAKVIAVEEPGTRLRQRSANRQDQSENPNVVRFSVTIAPDAPPGPRDLWIITPKGPTNRFKFLVGELPEVNEADDNHDNDTLETAQSLASLPILVNGQVDQGDRDIFRFTAKAGQTIVCDFKGQSILPYVADAVPGWLQACMTLYDSTGEVIAYVDDWRFRPDPVVIHKVERDGEYRLEVKDTLFRGREDLVYRLSIGELPFITHIYPLGGKRETDAQVELHGVNLPAATTSFAIPGDSSPIRQVQVNAKGLTSNVLPFAVGDRPESQEAEPNDDVEKAQRIETPVTINGRIQQDGDADYFVFSAKAKDVVMVDAWARRLESPLDPIITLYTAKGGRLAENDDTMDESQGLITHHADSHLAYTIRTDGDYIIRIGDVQSLGGHEYAYRLSVGAPRPDFDLRVFPANLSVAKGASTVAKIKAYRRHGFNGQIRVTATGLPPGFVASEAVVGAGQKETRLTVTAPPDASLGIISPTFAGKAKIGEAEVGRMVAPAEDLMQAFYYRHDVPADDLLLAVIEPMSLALSADGPAIAVHEVERGGKFDVTVKVSREGLKTALARAEAVKTQTDEALARVKADVAQATAEYNAAEKAAKGAVTAATTAKAAAAKAATARNAAATTAATKRQQANAAKKKLDDLVQSQQAPAAAKLAAAVKAVSAATAAKAPLDKALADAKAATAGAQATHAAADKAAQEAEAAAKAIAEDAAKSEEEKKAAADTAVAKRKAATDAMATLTQAQQKEQEAQSQVNAAAQAVSEANAQKTTAEQALANIKGQVAAASAAYEAAEKAAKDAEAAAVTAKTAADNARAAQAAADQAVPEKRKLADAAKAKRDRMPAVEKVAAAKAAEANKRVEAVKQADKGNISLKADTPPKGITVKTANIPAGQDQATVTVTVTTQAAVGLRDNIILTANLKAGQDTFTVVAPAIPIKVIAPPK
jgi:hypothetical protein